MPGFLWLLNVRYWPKADINGRVLSPNFDRPAIFGLLSVCLQPKADIQKPEKCRIAEFGV